MNKKKQIVFVNQSAGYLMIDIIDAFKDEYDERILITGFLNPRNRKLDVSVKVENIIKYDRSSSFKRILTWVLAFFKTLWLIKIKYPKAHLFLVSNPPFTSWIPLFCKNSYDVLIYDVYPDALTEFRYFKPESWLIKTWEKVNRKVFANAKKISTITEGMQKRLSKYVEISKIQLVPIWTDNEFLKPISKSENIFLKEYQLEDKFVVMYSGNMGKSHPVEILVELAIYFKNNSEIFFLLIGGGDKYRELESTIKTNKLQNIKIMPWQDTHLLPFTLSAADIALVTVGNEASDLSIPSKTYNLMSVGTPILCVAPQDAALARLVENEKIGEVFQDSNFQSMVDFIKKSMINFEFLNYYKSNALKASLNYTPYNASKFI